MPVMAEFGLMGFEPEARKKKWDVGKFDDGDIKDAVDRLTDAAQFFYPNTPNLVPAFWPVADPLPTIRDLDFGHVVDSNVALNHLKASQNWLRVDQLIWHLQNPGKAAHKNPYTSMPVVLVTAAGPTIVDGHHRLGALLLLGCNDVDVSMLPAPEQPKE